MVCVFVYTKYVMSICIIITLMKLNAVKNYYLITIADIDIHTSAD